MNTRGLHTNRTLGALAAVFACQLVAVQAFAQTAVPPAPSPSNQAAGASSASGGKPLPVMQKPQQPLDLRIPDVTELFTPDQIQAILSHTASDDYEEVEVRGARIPSTPDVWGGLAAPVWGLLNPTQAWRIIAPIPPDQIHAADVRPEAQPLERDPFRP
jgi:hypothetical protein